MIRTIVRLVLVCLMLAGVGIAIGLWSELRAPEVVRYRVALPHWPVGQRPMTLAFLSDTHVAGPDMTPARLSRIVAATNALRADCILLGGDYVSQKAVATRHYPLAVAIAPFARLRAPGGVIAVTGNHDHGPGDTYRDADRAFAAARIPVLAGGMARCGPIGVFGVDNPVRGDWQLYRAGAGAARYPGPALLLAHTPELFFHPHARAFRLTIAGHTHCGQIALPWFGAITGGGFVPRRYACGLHRVGGRTLIVGGGLGTSGVPLRLFTRPQILLIEVGPPARLRRRDDRPPAPAARRGRATGG